MGFVSSACILDCLVPRHVPRHPQAQLGVFHGRCVALGRASQALEGCHPLAVGVLLAPCGDHGLLGVGGEGRIVAGGWHGTALEGAPQRDLFPYPKGVAQGLCRLCDLCVVVGQSVGGTRRLDGVVHVQHACVGVQGVGVEPLRGVRQRRKCLTHLLRLLVDLHGHGDAVVELVGPSIVGRQAGLEVGQVALHEPALHLHALALFCVTHLFRHPHSTHLVVVVMPSGVGQRRQRRPGHGLLGVLRHRLSPLQGTSRLLALLCRHLQVACRHVVVERQRLQQRHLVRRRTLEQGVPAVLAEERTGRPRALRPVPPGHLRLCLVTARQCSPVGQGHLETLRVLLAVDDHTVVEMHLHRAHLLLGRPTVRVTLLPKQRPRHGRKQRALAPA